MTANATPEIRVLVSCQNLDCAEQVSYHLDMVRMWNGLPVCEECHNHGGHPILWSDLPPVKIEDLTE